MDTNSYEAFQFHHLALEFTTSTEGGDRPSLNDFAFEGPINSVMDGRKGSRGFGDGEKCRTIGEW